MGGKYDAIIDGRHLYKRILIRRRRTKHGSTLSMLKALPVAIEDFTEQKTYRLLITNFNTNDNPLWQLRYVNDEHQDLLCFEGALREVLIEATDRIDILLRPPFKNAIGK